MTTRPFAHRLTARATRPFWQTLWTIALVVAMGATLSACETFSFGSKPTPRTSETQGSRPVAVTPTQPGEAPPGTQGNSGQVKVALLLPFSHPDRNARYVAQSLLNAAQMAMFDMGSRTMMLLPRDTNGTPEGAAAAANDAINSGAELILGPLLAADVRGVSPVARAKNVPVIAFSTDRTVAGDGVFLLSFLPETEVTRVVDYAIAQGRQRFAALVPATPYGQRAEEAFSAAVTSAGRQIVAVQTYQPNPQALEPAINAIAKTGFDAIFLPEGGAMLRSMGPILLVKTPNASQVKLLGTGLWDDPAVTKEASLIGGWYSMPPQDQRQAFATRYQQLYNARPPRIASLAYDAVALAATLSRGSAGHRFTREAISDPNGFSGIDGIFRFLPNGFTERGLAVMEIAPNGQLVVASPAAATFQAPGF
ncbi:MAG: ABC transporter substrate-binding protein [Alphaproteobacteria bacterium]|nr:ABC transporter substrate-binding protein [Alphaproteobacteria bacterium]